MPAGVWKALAGIIAVLLVAVIALDQWQARREGLSSLFWTPGRPAAEARPAPPPPALPPAPPAPGGAPRIAVIVDDLGSRRDVFDLVREMGRPLAVGVLPDLPLSGWIAAEASRVGLEALLDLPMEPYRYPELDPGPGALMMAMPPPELSRRVARHLAALPTVIGVTNHMGSRMTEDRGRMRAALEPLHRLGSGARHLGRVSFPAQQPADRELDAGLVLDEQDRSRHLGPLPLRPVAPSRAGPQRYTMPACRWKPKKRRAGRSPGCAC